MKTPKQIKQEAESAFERGKTYYEKKEYDLAIKEYSEAIRLDPSFVSAYYMRFIVYMAKDKITKKENNQLGKDLDKVFMLDPYFNRKDDTQGKCSFCGLPAALAHGIIEWNDKKICVKCINKTDIMKRIERNNKAFYKKINEDTWSNSEGNISICFDMSSDFTLKINNLTIEELRIKAREYEKPKLPKPININNIPIHKNKNSKLLKREVFKKHPKKDVKVSNFGRVKRGNCILEQYDPQNNGYLFVDIKSTKKTVSEKVCRLVAETWLERPDIKGQSKDKKNEWYNTVHHISNNGYDNRIENLMWVTEWQHAMINPWMDINKFNLKELNDLFNSYADINIPPNEYQRIINIAKRMQQLENVESKFPGKYDYWYENIIEAMEDLIK